MEQFSKEYNAFIHLDLERENDLSLFEEYRSVQSLWDALSIEYGVSGAEQNPVLLFIDEVQESPKAIQLLRFFYEELPHVHVITAGSLLEFAMGEVKSFPVGRVEFLYIHPMDFEEYIVAAGNEQLVEAYRTTPVPVAALGPLLTRFNRYAIIGGMPEVVATYVEQGSVSSLPRIYNSIWNTYREDVRRYAENKTDERLIRYLFDAAPALMDKRLTFHNFGKSDYRSREVGEAFRRLDDAGIIRLMYPVTEVAPPILPDIKKSPRMQFLDTGLLNHANGIQAELLAVSDLTDFYRGALIPHLVIQEHMAGNSTGDDPPHFWVRDKSQSQAEVDLVIPLGGLIIPIEVKSGPVGKLRSLHQFIDRCPHDFAVRLYAGPLRMEEHRTPSGKNYRLLNLPYFLGGRLAEHISWFMT